MKRLTAYLLLIVFVCMASRAQDAGSFSRLGFGARGMGMGNALTAVGSGDISPYYNPALAAFAEMHTASASFGILSLDRSLNFLCYTQPVQPQAGLSIAFINSGVSNIDGRDADGVHTENLSTFEDQFLFAFANRISDQISLGVAIKLNYSKLYDQVTTTTVGFDAGGYFQITPNVSLGVAIKDIGAKYKWDTTPIYGTDGTQITDQFPTLKKIGIAYTFPANTAILSAEFENSSSGTSIMRIGAEYALVKNFNVRGGVDRLDWSDNATGAKPTFGFTVKNTYDTWTPVINYAYVYESFAPQGMHIITLSLLF